MRSSLRTLIITTLSVGWVGPAAQAAQISDGATPPVDWDMVARIREEGLQRSQLANTLSYMTDVLGARLTNSLAMERAQRWAIDEMNRIGLVNTVTEPSWTTVLPGTTSMSHCT